MITKLHLRKMNSFIRHCRWFLLVVLVLCSCASLFFTIPVDAACPKGQVETNFFGCVKDDKDGCGVWMTINLILTVLTFGVGIAATVGIVITAILYITSRDDSGQLAKAKRRILEIVVGLAIYAAMWSIISWIIPGGVFNEGSVCKTSTPTEGSSSQTKYGDDDSKNKKDKTDKKS